MWAKTRLEQLKINFSEVNSMRVIDADALEKSLENSCETEFEAMCFLNFMCYMDEQPTLDSIVFPQTIGNITYYSAEELIEWVKKQQALNNVDGRCCLFCNHSMSSDAPDGSQVLVCFECDGFDGKEIIVGDDECCKNYSN